MDLASTNGSYFEPITQSSDGSEIESPMEMSIEVVPESEPLLLASIDGNISLCKSSSPQLKLISPERLRWFVG